MKERINKLVNECGLNYNKIATLSGVPVTSLNDWCKGRRPGISDENMEKLGTWLKKFKEQVSAI